VRRAILALVGTAAGTALLVGAKANLGHPVNTAATAPEPTRAAGSKPPSSGPAPGPAQSPAQSPAKGGRTTAPAKTNAPAPPGNGLNNGTFNGAPSTNDYGTVQLAIVVSTGKITDIKVLEQPHDEARSAQLSQAALPKLRTEALKAQSATVDTYSGATETSESFKKSLQSAITAARGG
jgi:uncharacterized protein with FMN-binding domain